MRFVARCESCSAPAGPAVTTIYISGERLDVCLACARAQEEYETELEDFEEDE
jgi:ribosome-binding protein aMBF1 (putative translation factor)